MKMHRAMAALAVGCLSSFALAAPLGVPVELPMFAYNSNGVTTFEAATGAFTVNATPLLYLPESGTPAVVLPTTQGQRYVQVDAQLTSAGELVSGTFRLYGALDTDGNGSVDVDGELLAGELVAFGFADSPGTVDQYDVVIHVTSGQLDAQYGGRNVVMTIASEHSNFAGDFTVDFTGGAKGNIGSTCAYDVTPPEVVVEIEEIEEELRCDMNDDGVVNYTDYCQFYWAYRCGRPEADFNNDGRVNCWDFSEFVCCYQQEQYNGCRNRQNDWREFELTFDATDTCSEVEIEAWIKVGRCYLPCEVESGDVVKIKSQNCWTDWWCEDGEISIKTRDTVKLVIRATDAAGNETVIWETID